MIPTVDHVAIAASSYAPHVGGVEELVRQLASEQLRGHGAPTVITMRWPKSLASAEVIDGVPVRRFLFRVPEGELKHRLLAYLAMPVTIARVALELRRSRAQVVHIQCVSSSAWFIEKATRFMGLPLVVTMQGELTMDADGVYERSAFLRTTLRRLLATADAVTACSRHTLEEAQEWAGIDLGGRGSVVYNGVRLSDFDEAESAVRESPYVFAVGRHVPQKGFDVLLDAFGRACGDSAFGWDLVIAGDGPEHDGLRAQAQRLDLGDRITFLGATDRRTTASLFKGCDLFVLPSRHEPFGIVNLEAMAAGRPIVATAVGGVPEFVDDGVTGFLVAPNDPSALAAAIQELHGDPVLAERLGEQGRARAAAFDWAEINSRYQQVYAEAIARHRGAESRPSDGGG